jgi:hypothetical protein
MYRWEPKNQKQAVATMGIPVVTGMVILGIPALDMGIITQDMEMKPQAMAIDQDTAQATIPVIHHMIIPTTAKAEMRII